VSPNSDGSTTAAVHDWLRASPYRTGVGLAGFLALFVASTAAPLSIVPAVFLGTLPVLVASVWLVERVRGRVGDDAGDPSDGRRSGRSRRGDRDPEAEGYDAALERLRERYAAGEIDEEEFERRVERLVETAGLRAEFAFDAGDGSATDDVGPDDDALAGARERDRDRQRA
jgi:hypothetical protein